MEFRYTACDQNGVSVKGQVTADSVEAVAEDLDRRGLIPIHLKPAHTGGNRWQAHPGSLHWKIEDKILFTRKFSSLLKAGIPLLSVLEMVAGQTREPQIAGAIHRIAELVSGGTTLSDAMAAFPGLFDEVYLGALRTGEATGRLDTVLEQTADFLEREMVTVRLVKKTVRYPIMVVVALIIAGGVVVGVVVPKFADFYGHFNASLPAPTRLLLAISHLVQRFWWMFPIVGVMAGLAWRSWMKTEAGRRRRDQWLLRIPLAGALLLKVLVIRFARLFGILYSAGIPAATALETVAAGVGNLTVKDEVQAMRERLSVGAPIAAPPGNAVMPLLVYQMLGIGFESGDVERMMAEVARHFDQEVEYDVRRLTDRLEPILLVVIASGVLFLALAVMLPMWNLAAVLRQ